MLFLIQQMDIYVRKNWAWTKAVDFCGGVVACGLLLGVHHSTISKWLSNPRRKIPYDYAVIISEHTKIPLKYLSPLTKTANEKIQKMSLATKGIPFINQQHLNQLGVKIWL